MLLIAPLVSAQSDSRQKRAAHQRSDEPDRLSNELERKVLKAVRDGKPDRVARLLHNAHRAFHVYIARAQTRAGFLADDPARKTARFEEAVRLYRDIVSLREDRSWFRGDVRRTEVVGWYVEMGDVLLRHLIAPDLDRYEITSGLTYDAPRLIEHLREANAAYKTAGELLDDLLIDLRTDEERFLLLGLADKIRTLDQQRRLNGAWAATYLAMIGGDDLTGRDNLLAEALSVFDDLSRSVREADVKYNALIGTGVSLREAGRLAEADSAFRRVKDSTASDALFARALFESAKTLLRANRFREARSELDALADLEPDASSEAGAAFYIRLAPLIKAWAYILEGKCLPPLSKPQQKKLIKQGREALASISAKGGIWPDIVQVYENEIDVGEGADGGPTLSQLRQRSRRAMTEQDYANGVTAFEAIVKHADADEVTKREAQFNLGVCNFQLGRLRAAAEVFSEAAAAGKDGDNALRAADYAYRCWRQLAADTKSREDYLRLAHVAELLVGRSSPSPQREEIEWIAALARHEAGDYANAQTAYSRITRTAKQYWQARRNIARCRQSIFDELPSNASEPRQRRAALAAIEAWTDLAERLQQALESESPKDELVGVSDSEEARRWIRDATLSAATLLAGNLVRDYEESLRLLGTMKPTPRVLALRIRCCRAMGDKAAANRALESFLAEASGPEFGSTLASLAADMEHETKSLRRLGRTEDARQVAADMAGVLRQLAVWTEQHPDNNRHIVIIRFSLAKALRQAGEFAEALKVLDGLMQSHPQDGSYLREAALTQEDVAQAANRGSRDGELDRAEALWEKLLRDATLRDNAPDAYWEARYYWLGHQLRHGNAQKVVKAIETERAWYPSLGGPPWQAKLLDLAAKARRCAPATTRPAGES